ncbi:hypothetical protein LINGRAHAP2_LOCUS16929 [Linum grandiflorum]
MDKSSHDYHTYISEMMRAPSIMYGVPQYPDVHKAFKHDPRYFEQQERQQLEQHQQQQQLEQQQKKNKKKKKKIFERCKWKTFRV